MERHQLIERSIIKKYRKTIWNNFVAAIKDYELIREGDRIGVCISGGKDSMLLAKCMQHLQKYSDFEFSVEYIVMDPGYNPENRAKIIENARLLDLPITIFDSPIFNSVQNVGGGTPCYLCARMRRGYLYKQAQDMGCNKIALGHHFDDAIETTMMSMLYGAEIKTMMPKLKSTNFEGMELIRPLYMVRERDIIAWARYNELEFIRCACSVTQKNEANCDGSKRQEVKELIRKLTAENDKV
ncbi:MAG: tRNA 2-thiocytidine biosynthesis protein TtcA, partial [Clostridia bacterium]|nr:tRNA 2-thiocytidine biosynthesis protein TtcA [Clostridia bacterium]